VICLIVVCIATESATVSSSSVFVSFQPSFLLPTRGGRLSTLMSGTSKKTVQVKNGAELFWVEEKRTKKIGEEN
jgi:hypothetical protein